MGQMTFNFETEDNEPEETQVEEIKVEKKEAKVSDKKVEIKDTGSATKGIIRALMLPKNK